MPKQYQNLFTRLLSKIRSAVITETPIELAACEYCRKTECSQGNWETCENRIKEMNYIKQNRLQQNDSQT